MPCVQPHTLLNNLSVSADNIILLKSHLEAEFDSLFGHEVSAADADADRDTLPHVAVG